MIAAVVKGLAMCLAIPGQIVEFLPGSNDQLALVDVVGVKRKINISLRNSVDARADGSGLP